MDDESLARQAQSGDREAFAELMHRQAAPVGRLLAAMVDRRDLVEDLVQETFCSAWAALPRYRSHCFGAWIRQIALNCGRQCLRAAWTRRVWLSSDPPEPVGPGAHNGQHPVAPDQALLDDERARRIRAAIARLPHKQGEAVRLRFLLGESYPAAAALLGVPEGTVRSRVHAGVTRLRAELADYFEEYEQ